MAQEKPPDTHTDQEEKNLLAIREVPLLDLVPQKNRLPGKVLVDGLIDWRKMLGLFKRLGGLIYGNQSRTEQWLK